MKAGNLPFIDRQPNEGEVVYHEDSLYRDKLSKSLAHAGRSSGTEKERRVWKPDLLSQDLSQAALAQRDPDLSGQIAAQVVSIRAVYPDPWIGTTQPAFANRKTCSSKAFALTRFARWVNIS